jgi:hypothetical protein
VLEEEGNHLGVSMDLASKFDTKVAVAAFKKKMTTGSSSSPERYKAESAHRLIGDSLKKQKKGFLEKARWREAGRRNAVARRIKANPDGPEAKRATEKAARHKAYRELQRHRHE